MKVKTLRSPPKKNKKKPKKRKLSDPDVNSITAYLSSSLNIITPNNSPSSRKKAVSPLQKSPNSGKKKENLGSPSVLEAFLTKGKENLESSDKMDAVDDKLEVHQHKMDKKSVSRQSSQIKIDNMFNLNDKSPETPKKQKIVVSKVNLENVISKAIAESNKDLLKDANSDKLEKTIEAIIISNEPIAESMEVTPSSKTSRKRGRPKKNSLSLKKEVKTTVDNQSECAESNEKESIDSEIATTDKRKSKSADSNKTASKDSKIRTNDKRKNECADSNRKASKDSKIETNEEIKTKCTDSNKRAPKDSKIETSQERQSKSDESNKRPSKDSKIETNGERKCEEVEINLSQDSDETGTPKQKKNAFEFMMYSRHKSIGTNSPGKVRKSPETDKKNDDRSQVTARKKLLENWANTKGALKRKQDEIDRDEIIAHKLEVRAKRLKRLLDGKYTVKDKKKAEKKRKRISRIDSDSESSRDSFSQASIQNFVQASDKNDNEDNEIKIYLSDENSKDQEPVFKIKMFSPQVFKRKKRKTENPETKTVDLTGNVDISQNIDTNNIIEISDDKTVNIHIKIDLHANKAKQDTPATPKSAKNSKAKTIKEIARAKLQFSNSDCDTDASMDGDVCGLRRSSRSAKKPQKYADMCHLSSNEDSNDSVVVDLETAEKKAKKNKKLAPVFAKATPKPKLDPAVVEARRKFLTSGIPDALKKIIEREQSIEEYQFDVFPSTSHVQQRHTYSEDSLDYWNLEKPSLEIASLLNSPLKFPPFEKGSVSKCTEKSQSNILKPGPKIKNYKRIIQEIKAKNPDYPVYKSFRLLSKKSNTNIPKTDKKSTKRKKRGKKVEIEKTPIENLEKHEMWTEKYKANCSEDILGNNKSVADLKDWLQSWLDVNDETKDAKSKKGYSSDSDFDGDDTRDGFRGLSNAVILTGPHGCGKTMTVYALCNEMGINVIESNASNKRTGKRLLQELQEATQSHQVRNNEPTGLSTFLQPKKEKPQATEEIPTKRKMCVLLVEDLDLVFEQDEGFLSALGQLLTTSKRPIILTTTDTTCTYLQKFVTQYHVIKFSPLSSRVLSVWLQILCLVEGVNVACEDLAEMLDFYKGDARKTLLQLQIFVQGGGSIFEEVERTDLKGISKANKVGNVRDDDELSFCSIEEDFDGESAVKTHKNCVYNFFDRDCMTNDLTLEKVWWNLPSFNKKSELNDLTKVFNLYDAMSDIDVVYTKSNISETERILERTSGLKDSLELKECIEYYSPKTNFVKNWSNTLLEMSIDGFTDIRRFNINLPNSTQKRWIKKQKDCRDKFSDLAPLGCQLDRRSYDLDYFPALRTISRSEEERSSNNVKRKNRFFNYLRSFDFHCGDAMTQTACSILIVKEWESS